MAVATTAQMTRVVTTMALIPAGVLWRCGGAGNCEGRRERQASWTRYSLVISGWWWPVVMAEASYSQPVPAEPDGHKGGSRGKLSQIASVRMGAIQGHQATIAWDRRPRTPRQQAGGGSARRVLRRTLKHGDQWLADGGGACTANSKQRAVHRLSEAVVPTSGSEPVRGRRTCQCAFARHARSGFQDHVQAQPKGI